jgi:ArsR family transcriptional regulator
MIAASDGWVRAAAFIGSSFDGVVRARSHQPVLTDQSTLIGDLKALADPMRLRIVELLAGEQLCTCHLVADLGATSTNVSNHLRVLRDAGFIASEPAGRYTYHRLLPGRVAELSRRLGELADRAETADAVKRPCG